MSYDHSFTISTLNIQHGINQALPNPNPAPQQQPAPAPQPKPRKPRPKKTQAVVVAPQTQPQNLPAEPTIIPQTILSGADGNTVYQNSKPPYGSGDVEEGFTLTFENLDAFMDWKAKEEEEQCVEFIKGDSHHSKAIPPRFKEHTKLVCARHTRTGRKKYVKKFPDRQRKTPSRKIEGTGCPASVSFKTYHDTPMIRASYHSHHSHEIGPANIPFTRKGRRELASKTKSNRSSRAGTMNANDLMGEGEGSTSGNGHQDDESTNGNGNRLPLSPTSLADGTHDQDQDQDHDDDDDDGDLAMDNSGMDVDGMHDSNDAGHPLGHESQTHTPYGPPQSHHMAMVASTHNYQHQHNGHHPSTSNQVQRMHGGGQPQTQALPHAHHHPHPQPAIAHQPQPQPQQPQIPQPPVQLHGPHGASRPPTSQHHPHSHPQSQGHSHPQHQSHPVSHPSHTSHPHPQVHPQHSTQHQPQHPPQISHPHPHPHSIPHPHPHPQHPPQTPQSASIPSGFLSNSNNQVQGSSHQSQALVRVGGQTGQTPTALTHMLGERETLMQGRWDRMAVLFQHIRNQAVSHEFPSASLTALEMLLIRMYVDESPVASQSAG